MPSKCGPRGHHAAPWTGTLLAGSEQLATFVDGPQCLPPGGASRDVVPFIPGVPAVESSPEAIQNASMPVKIGQLIVGRRQNESRLQLCG
jgi:hypothetical protein